MKHPIKLRTIFMGTSVLAEGVLEKMIAEKYNIVSVFTAPDKKIGRKQEAKKGSVKVLAEKYKIPVLQPSKFDEDIISEIKKLTPDLIIVAAYGKILPKEVLEIPGFGALNIHPSLLPKYRGPSPVQNALLNGDRETGVTIMKMNEGVDSGEIIGQGKTKIGSNEVASSLLERLSQSGALLLLEVLPKWINGKIIPKKQKESEATLCQLIEREDGRIFWDTEAKEIYNKFRALHPWPGVFTYWEVDNSIKRIKLNNISVKRSSPQSKHEIGEIFEIADKVGVETSKGVVILESLQLEGKKEADIKTFINGYPNFIGSILK